MQNKISLTDQIRYFEAHPTNDEADALLSVISLYGDEFFEYWTIDELMGASDQDVEFLERVFAAADLSDIFNESVGDLRLYQAYVSHINDKNLPPDQRLMYRQKAFTIANMSGVRYNDDGTVDLIVENSDSGYDAFIDWFYDGSLGYSGANPRYVAEKLFNSDDFWEPYDDLVQNWIDDVWDATNAKTIQYVRDYIKENILPVDIYPNDIRGWDEDDYADELTDDGYFILTPERLDQLSDDELGNLIRSHDDFDDLKNEMRWAYEEGYNQAVISELHEAYTDAILETVQGSNPRWENTGRKITHRYERDGEKREYTSEEQIFVIPNIIFFDILETWADNNVGYETEFQYNFIDTVTENLKESELLAPDPSEWPNSNTVEELYNDGLLKRI